MQREVIKWLQSLDLTTTVKNPRRDLATGFTPAEIVSRYADDNTLSMHSISSGVSSEAKRNNWRLVMKALTKLGCATISDALVDAVLRLQPNAAATVLEDMYEFFTKRTLPMRSIDAYGANGAYLRPADTKMARVLLETTGEVAVGEIPGRAADDGNNGTKDFLNLEEDEDEEFNRQVDQLAAAVVQEKLALTANAELAGGTKPIQEQPRYTRPTAAALLKNANGPRHNVSLRRDKYTQDEFLANEHNERILAQHAVMEKAIRESEPARQEQLMGFVPLTTVLRGPYSTARLNRQRRWRRKNGEDGGGGVGGDDIFSASFSSTSAAGSGGIRRVEVNVLGDALCTALERNGVFVNGGERAQEKSIEAFAACNFDIRRGVSSILRDVLAAHHELVVLVELSGGAGGEGGDLLDDVLTSVIAHRDALSVGTMEACWTALGQNVDGIAACIMHDAHTYGYLVQALGYLFSLESAQVPLLHVSSATGDHNTSSSPTLSSGVPEGGGNHMLRPLAHALGRHRSQSVGYALLSSARRTSANYHDLVKYSPIGSISHQHQPHVQQAVLLDKQAFHVASGFVFFSRLGEALVAAEQRVKQRAAPKQLLFIAQRGLIDYFLPSASRALLPSGTTAIVEAVARVIVCSVVNPAASDQRSAEDANLDTLLAQYVQPMVMGTASSSSSPMNARSSGDSTDCVVSAAASAAASAYYGGGAARVRGRSLTHSQRTQRWCLLFYHVLRQLSDARAEDPAPPLLLPGDAEDGKPLSPLAVRAHAMALTCLTSEQRAMHEVGLALLNQLTVWNCLKIAFAGTASLVLAPIVESRQSGVKCEFLSRDASSWELRAIALELLTVTFRKTVAVLVARDEEKNAGTTGDDAADSAAVARSGVMELQLSELDTAIALCLRSFSRAPLSLRQLALGIVGRRLLPDYQPRVASAWLRMLRSFPHNVFKQCLLPYEDQPKDVRRNTAAPTTIQGGAGGGTAAAAAPASVLYHVSALAGKANPLGGALGAAPAKRGGHTPASMSPRTAVTWDTEDGGMDHPFPCAAASTGGGASAEQSLSSITMLIGHVESAYVVAPLNQSWDTFGVVHLLLQRVEQMTEFEALSIVSAALLSPQKLDVQQGQLLHNMRLALLPAMGEGAGATLLNNGEDEDEGKSRLYAKGHAPEESSTRCYIDEELSDKSEYDLTVTLRDLVLSQHSRYARGNSDEDEEGFRGSNAGDAMVNVPEFCKDGGDVAAVLTEPAGDGEMLTSNFWISALKRLLPLITAALDGEDSDEQRGEDEDDAVPFQTAAEREMAVAILFTLFGRYAPPPPGTPNGQELLDLALRWAEK